MKLKLKTEKEIRILQEGGKRHALILKQLAKFVKPGITSQDLEDEALRLVKANGDEPAHLNYMPRGASRPYPATLCVSINDEIVHGIPNERKKTIQEGDIVSIDLSIWHEGLVTDAAITVPCGKVSNEVKKLLKVTKLALEKGIKEAKPSKRVGDIGAAISKVVDGSGFSLAADLSGHGVGYAVHEEPFVPNFGIPGKGEKLVPGLVIAIEPMINIGRAEIQLTEDGYTIRTRDGSLSAHFEHTVAITKKGNIILTL